MKNFSKGIYTHRVLLPALTLSLGFSSFSAYATGYAEGLYDDFSEFSGNQVVFEISAVKPESLASSKNFSVGSFFSPGNYVFVYRLGMINIYDAKFEDGNLTSALIEERQEKMTEYENDRLPMSSGTFRLLSVKARIGKEVRISEAVEFCWASKGYCYVADNSIPNLNATVDSIRKLIASGYKETVTYGDPVATQSQAKATIICVVDGTTSKSKTRTNSATTNTAVYARRSIVGYMSYPESYVKQTCSYNSSTDTCSVSQDYSVGAVSGSANNGYQISCPTPKKDANVCGNFASFASEQGCAFGRSTSSWGFGFTAGGVGCNANVDTTSRNTVAINTRALNQSVTCVKK